MKKRTVKPATLSADDRHLWRRVTKTVSPLKDRNRWTAQAETSEEDVWLAWVEEQGMVNRTPVPQPAADSVKTKPTVPTTKQVTRTQIEKRAAPRLPQVYEIERPTHRKLAKGRLPIDARLDLHHQTQDQAHQSLIHFLSTSRKNGHRHVLVITGKGRSPNSQGVLRKMLPIWIATPPLNALVSGIRHASRDHGGEGAWYIRLKRTKTDQKP
ncbi:MAG: Smr/MutS family protein [Pseudomonadota bacterium]